jgi:hypothetical protein
VHAGCGDRGGDVHVEHHGVEECLQYGGDDQRTTRAAGG